jgi:hypothetical protein
MVDWGQLAGAVVTGGLTAWGAYKTRQQHRKAKSAEAIAEAPESIQTQLQEAAGKSAPETIRAFTALALLCQGQQEQLSDLETRFVIREQEQQRVITLQAEQIAQQQMQINELRAEVDRLHSLMGSQERTTEGGR